MEFSRIEGHVGNARGKIINEYRSLQKSAFPRAILSAWNTIRPKFRVSNESASISRFDEARFSRKRASKFNGEGEALLIHANARCISADTVPFARLCVPGLHRNSLKTRMT